MIMNIIISSKSLICKQLFIQKKKNYLVLSTRKTYDYMKNFNQFFQMILYFKFKTY